MKTLGALFLFLCFWAGGLIAGYYIGANKCIKADRPGKVRLSYVDTVPPPCAILPTRDARHVCEWSRVHQPPMQAIKQPRGGAR